jgi:hypothetical protein
MTHIKARKAITFWARPRWLSPAILAYACFLLIWLSLEDRQVGIAIALGIGGTILAIWHYACQAWLPWLRPYLPLLLGLSAGAGCALWAAALMFFKNALHAHLYPDYPPVIILETIGRAPIYMLAGALCGVAWLAWQRTKK